MPPHRQWLVRGPSGLWPPSWWEMSEQSSSWFSYSATEHTHQEYLLSFSFLFPEKVLPILQNSLPVWPYLAEPPPDIHVSPLSSSQMDCQHCFIICFYSSLLINSVKPDRQVWRSSITGTTTPRHVVSMLKELMKTSRSVHNSVLVLVTLYWYCLFEKCSPRPFLNTLLCCFKLVVTIQPVLTSRSDASCSPSVHTLSSSFLFISYCDVMTFHGCLGDGSDSVCILLYIIWLWFDLKTAGGVGWDIKNLQGTIKQ